MNLSRSLPVTARSDRSTRGRAAGWARRLLHRKTALVAGVTLIIVAGAAMGARVTAPYDPLEMHGQDRFADPSLRHWFGTDEVGRDLLSRVLYGTQVSLLVGLGSVLLSFVLGAAPGLVAGYRGGLLDDLVMRVFDGLLAFPGLLLALTIVAMLGPSLLNTALAIGIAGAPAVGRLTRAVALATKAQDYVLAARAIGSTDRRIVLRTILPNSMPPLIVQASLAVASAILSEAALSFLGLGVQPPGASLGLLLYTAYGFITQSWWYPVFPGLAIFLAVWSLNALGDGLRDALDPRLLQTRQVAVSR
jgi:peptide/nickel transport system permease protein